MLPCAVGLLVPGVVVLLLGGRMRVTALGGFVAAAGLVAWLRAADLVGEPASWLLGIAGVVGGLALALQRMPWSGPAGGALLGVIAGATWVPCVGDELGMILNAAPGAPLGQLVPMLSYVLGVCAVLVVLALIPVVFPRVDAWLAHPAGLIIGGLMATMITLALVTGLYGELLSEFAQLSVR